LYQECCRYHTVTLGGFSYWSSRATRSTTAAGAVGE